MKCEKTKCVVFDIDGTLANIGHRLHHIRSGGKKDWKTFKSLAIDDPVHEEVVAVFKAMVGAGHKIVLCTGRTEDERDMTAEWLDKHGLLNYVDCLFMRDEGDYRDDNVVKVEKLAEMRDEGFEPLVWFDDRRRVVDALREAGVHVFQVRPGEF